MQDQRANILVVDDDTAVRLFLSDLLTDAGYKVRCAKNGLDALANLRNATPDIILSDINMPGMSGTELMSLVRLLFPKIKLIAMSGQFADGILPPGIEADAFYAKGSAIGTLLGLVESMTQPQGSFLSTLSTFLHMTDEPR
jgi:CheY-like chemotaxis protein